MRLIQKLDRQVYKYAPDQMVVRLNEMIDTLNGKQVAVMVEDASSSDVIIMGRQPDGTFGLKKWTKQGDTYTFVSGVL